MRNTIKAIALILLLSISLNTNNKSIEVKGSATETLEEKIYCNASLEDNFDDDTILLTIDNKTSLSSKEYTIKDFKEIDCLEVEDMTKDLVEKIKKQEVEGYEKEENELIINKETFNRIIKIKLKDSTKAKVLNSIKILERRNEILSASPNYILENVPCATIPKNQYYGEQWAINKIQLPDAWDISTGLSTTKVGILDSGINYDNSPTSMYVDYDLSKSFIKNEIEDDYYIYDELGHGTFVSGIIANGNKTSGVVGTCWSATLISLRVFDAQGNSCIEWVISAINYANSIDIPILNFSGRWNTINLKEIYNVDEINDEINNKINLLSTTIDNYPGLIVCSSGNDGYSIDDNLVYPASLDNENIITVGATDKEDNRWIEESFSSNYGKVNVDLFAPGDSILSTYTINNCLNMKHIENTHLANGYHYNSGTSFAAPYVTGVAALLLSKYPCLTSLQIKEYILNNVDEIEGLKDYCVTGGRLNAYKALSAANHNYKNSYVSINSTHHKSYCEYGYFIEELHVLEQITIRGKVYKCCIYCEYQAEVSGSFVPGIMSKDEKIIKESANGSYVQRNGVIVLVTKEDKEAYLSGTLVFYNKDEEYDIV